MSRLYLHSAMVPLVSMSFSVRGLTIERYLMSG
jgi:hypothetical protein